MDPKSQRTIITVVKLVRGKVSGIQQLALKEGTTLGGLVEQKSITNLKISSVHTCAAHESNRNEIPKNVWRRCPCGMTFLYDDFLSSCAQYQKCQFCCKVLHDSKCLETHIASAHKTIKKQVDDVSNDTASSAECHKCPYCCRLYHDIRCLETHVSCVHKTIENQVGDVSNNNTSEDGTITDCTKELGESATGCENCNEQSKDKNNVGPYHKCRYCLQSFYKASQLEAHIKNVHGKIKKCPCGICNPVQEVEGESLDEGTICKRQAENARLRFLAYTRKEKKRHECPICKREFSTKSYMLEHKNSHNAVKNILCEFCGKMYSSIRMLRTHMFNRHSEKKIPCDFCSKMFCNFRSLKRHLLVHTNEKPHCCHLCGRMFAREYTLMMHLRVHNNFKPHVCKICNKAFCQPTNLKTHMRTHGIFIHRRFKNEKKSEL